MSIGRARLLAVALAAACLALLQAAAPSLLSGIDDRSGEAAWRLAARGEERRVVIVDIDEASLVRIGPWPWPRERMAELVRRLGELGTGTQVFDIVFPDARSGDDALAAEFARHPVVLGQIFSLRPGTPAAAGGLNGALDAPACGGAHLAEADGYIGNAPVFAGPAGHLTPRIDGDGAVRHLPALVCFEGRAYPALGIAALLRAAELGPTLDLVPGRGWLAPAWELRHPGLPGIVVPLAANGDVRLSYGVPRGGFVAVSASDVLEGRVPAHLLRGAIALIGATAFGIGDVVPTPHGGAVGGIEVHAQFISALLDGRLPHAPRAASGLKALLAVAGVALLLAIAVGARRLAAATPVARRYLPVWGLPLVALVLAAGFLILHASLLLGVHLWLGWAEPAVFVLLSGILIAAVEHAYTRFERERLFGNLSAYLPEPVARKIAFKRVSGAIEAERREVTVLFADIRNFSAYCEGRPPEETAALLHEFFATVTGIVETHGGLVEEFAGDAVMAVWNAHAPCADHAQRAFAAAGRIIEECGALFPDPPPPGLEPLAVGIGLETGDALVGSFGPAQRRTHTVLGETVTVAVRLTALTGELAYPLLIGEKAATRLGADKLQTLGEFLLEGLRRPRRIHAPAAPAAIPVLKLVRAGAH